MFELRYESLVAAPDEVGRQLAGYLGAPPESLAAALGEAHAASIGRYERDLTQEQLSDVVAEAGDLLRELGYLEDAETT